MAEYGDVVINNYSDAQACARWYFPTGSTASASAARSVMPTRFKFKAGGNDINMYKIIEGKFCGACHNGNVAWSVKNCILCHSGKPARDPDTRKHDAGAGRSGQPLTNRNRRLHEPSIENDALLIAGHSAGHVADNCNSRAADQEQADSRQGQASTG